MKPFMKPTTVLEWGHAPDGTVLCSVWWPDPYHWIAHLPEDVLQFIARHERTNFEIIHTRNRTEKEYLQHLDEVDSTKRVEARYI
jgi:hypothetical protein